MTDDPKLFLFRTGSIQKVGISEETYDGDTAFVLEFEDSTWFPGATVISSLEIYKGILLVIVRQTTGHYQIFRSYDGGKPTLVHDHATEIYEIIQLDMGSAIFSATDGYWITSSAGTTWDQIGSDHISRNFVIATGQAVNEYTLYVYCEDRKIYSSAVAGIAPLSFTEIYDTSAIWSGVWYPAIDGSVLGLLVGAGPHLLRYENGVWSERQEIDGIISQILISDKTSMPMFMITIERTDETNDFRETYDFGDTLIQNINRVFPQMNAAAVYPTGDSSTETTFVFTGKRDPSDVNRQLLFTKNRGDLR